MVIIAITKFSANWPSGEVFKTTSAERLSNKCKNKVTKRYSWSGNILNKKEVINT